MFQLEQWLLECETTHPNCKQEISKTLPVRLVEVAPHGCSNPRLVFTNYLNPEIVRYTTLSYCWGNGNTLKTQQSNVDDFHEALPIGDLARTHRDAIEITKALDIPYIWIDALCIVQDYQIDWSEESVKMCKIYSGSVLTTAASEAESSDGGFFADIAAPKDSITPRRAMLHVATEECRPDRLLHVLSKPGFFPYSPALSRRGWALQKSVLSRRTVEVKNSELHRRCRTCQHWENAIEGDRTYHTVRMLDLKWDAMFSSTWRHWMHNYLSRELTYQTDLLPAIAGLVRYYQQITGDAPYLGLWRNSLREDLLWVCRRPDRQRRKANLPSESPLSRSGVVNYSATLGNLPIESCVQVVDFNIEWAGIRLFQN